MDRRIAVGLALILSGPARHALAASQDASEPPSVRLTLADAIARAREASARLAQLRSLETVAGAGLRGARAARMPLLEVSATYLRHSDVPELVIALPGLSGRPLFPNIPDKYRTRAELTLPLYTGGRLESAVAAASEHRSAAAKDYEAGMSALVLETTAAYWSLVAARESERVLGEALDSYEAHLKDARNREAVGLAARNEVLAVQVERDRAEMTRLQAANAAAVTHANLLRLLDLPSGSGVEAVEPATVPRETPENVAALLGRAAGRPEIVALRSRIAAAEANATQARGASLPQARVFAGYDYARPNPEILPMAPEWKSTWSVGVSVSVTAFDGGRAAAAVVQARAQAEATRHQLEDLERHIRLEVTSRLLELATARAQLEVADRSIEAARENLRVSEERYREGVSSSSDRLDAETALLRSGLDRTEAATGLCVALARLDHAVGR